MDSNSNANLYKNAVCFNLNECDFPPLPSPASRSKPLRSPVKCVDPVRKPIRPLVKSFAQGYKTFRLTVLPACSIPVSISDSSLHQNFIHLLPQNVLQHFCPYWYHF